MVKLIVKTDDFVVKAIADDAVVDVDVKYKHKPDFIAKVKQLKENEEFGLLRYMSVYRTVAPVDYDKNFPLSMEDGTLLRLAHYSLASYRIDNKKSVMHVTGIKN